MAKRELPTADYVRSILHYEPETGELRWRERPVTHFRATGGRTAEHACAVWNARYAGAVAGTDGDGYILIGIDGRIYRAHRIAWLWMTGEWPKDQVDHKNMRRADNRWENLREASHSQNNGNRRAYSNNTSGVKGVYWHKLVKKWKAEIQVNGRTISVGYFDEDKLNEAAAAYAVAALEWFGEYARSDGVANPQ